MDEMNRLKGDWSPRNMGDGFLLYLVGMVLLVLGSFLIGAFDMNFEISAIVVELFAIAVPTLAFVLLRKRNWKAYLRLHFLRPIDGILVIGIFLTAYPVGVFLNFLVTVFMMQFGTVVPPDIPVPVGAGEFLLQLLSIAGSAALCEELMFRGFMLRAFEGLDWKKAIFISAGLFSALHLSLQNMAATFYLGLILGFVVYKTNSIYAGMLGHFLNNTIAIVLNKTLRGLTEFRGGDAGISAAALPSGFQILISILVLGVFAGLMALAQGGLLFILTERATLRALKENPGMEFIGPIREKGRLSWRTAWPMIPAGLIFTLFIIMEIMELVSSPM